MDCAGSLAVRANSPWRARAAKLCEWPVQGLGASHPTTVEATPILLRRRSGLVIGRVALPLRLTLPGRHALGVIYYCVHSASLPLSEAVAGLLHVNLGTRVGDSYTLPTPDNHFYNARPHCRQV